MVVISVTGGLGNQMFYYALYRYLQMQGIDVWLDVNWYSGTNYNGFPIPYIAGEVEHCKYKLEDYFHLPKIRKTEIETSIKIAKKRLEVQINCESSSSSYIKKAIESKDIYLSGYYQNWDCCYEIRNILINDFVFPISLSENIKALLNEIEISNSVSIHVRRGDYFRTEHYAIHHGSICNMNYYRNSINYFTGKFKDSKFFIFSDDVLWAKNKFSDFGNCIVVDTRLEKYSDYYDLLLISKCKHDIISNSSFSWWGAFLNPNEDKIVIVPTVWNRNLNFEKTDYICPPDWIRISNNPQISIPKNDRNVFPIVYLINFPIYDHSFQIFSDDVYHAAVSMQSIIENSNNSSSFIFYILHQYISEENIDKIKKQLTHVHNFSIEFIDITELLLEHELYTINTVDSYTFNYYAPYIKFFIPYILRQYDRLLYIDTSIIFNLDIAAVFETYINDNAFTCWSDPNQPNLFSTDLMLINTKRFHDITPEHTFLEKINDNKKTRNLDKSAADLPPDQYFLNTFFADNIASFSRDSYNKEIINLKGNEQWTNIYASNIQYILKYASRTEFFNEILNSLLEKDRSITDRLQHLEEEKNAFKYNEIIMRNLRSSYSYRIGRLITWPLRIFLKCYRCYRHFGFRYTLNLIIKRGKSFILYKNRKILL